MFGMGDARMWRLILVTFAFLGWSFYELSGGADYVPGENSLQVARAEKRAADADRARRLALAPKSDKRPEALPVAANGADLVLASVRADDGTGDDKRVRLTLSAQPDTTGRGVATVTVDPAKIIALTEPAAPAQPLPAGVNPAVAALQAALDTQSDEPSQNAYPAPTADGADIRKIVPARVNLREGPGTDYGVAGKLTKGTKVQILYDDGSGWVELVVMDSGQQGWMADFLLAPAY